MSPLGGGAGQGTRGSPSLEGWLWWGQSSLILVAAGKGGGSGSGVRLERTGNWGAEDRELGCRAFSEFGQFPCGAGGRGGCGPTVGPWAAGSHRQQRQSSQGGGGRAGDLLHQVTGAVVR